ncbi:MAG TPA: protein kinase [Polyangiales bacterium]|nr:protein kinase [Polyangiales bacterium]
MLRAEPAARSVRALLPAMDIAARSMMESQAIAGTIAGVVADRALDHHWQGLFQYASIRVGQELAASLLEKLEAEAGDAPQQELDLPPGPPARLYRRMRELVAAEKGAPIAPDSAQYWPPSDEKLARGFVALRKALSAQQSELAELRYARGLRDVEAAYVLDIEPADAQRGIEAAIATTAKLLGRRPQSRDNTPEGALLEAFALDPRSTRPPRRARRKPVLAEGALIAGRYEIEEPLGAGAFADVYRARDRDVTDHVVALKILRRRAADAAAVHAALRELQLIASVFHPSVVQLKDHGWHEGHLWFVMPLYRGETLATRLKRAPLTRRQAREIFTPLAEALATMHRAGVRHQDVKPENVFLANLDLDESEDGVPQRVLPVMLDLGVAAKDAELVLAGTPAYFAPEVAARFAGAPDPPPVGPKADVFSLALTLMHALDPTPREYVAAGAVDAFVAYRAAHAPKISPVRELSDLRPYFSRWLNFSPDARPSAEEFVRELGSLTRPEERAARRWAIMRWALPTLFALMAVFAAVLFAFSRENELQRRERQLAETRAQEARQRADNIYQDLTVQEAKRKELEKDVARLEQEYQTSRMTREQLATRLAQTEAELLSVAEREKALNTTVAQQQREAHQLRESNGRVSSELASATQRNEELSGELDRQRARRQEVEGTATQLREQVKRETDALETARSRISDLEERLARMRNDLSAPPLDRPNKHGLTPSL